MTPTEVFSIANMMAMPMWILMILSAKWKVTRFLIDFKIVPIILSILYTIFIIKSMLNGPAMDFGSLESVMKLFTAENAVLAGWIHYLVFDLLVGMWMLDENKRLELHPLIMAPCLMSTFILGPVGFLIFMAFRAFKNKSHEIH